MTNSTITEIQQTLNVVVKNLFGEDPKLNKKFDHFCRKASDLTGKPIAFNIALCIILFWMLTGPLFGFNNTWQLIINTATTIVTFLMVFLIQHTQNRDNEVLHLQINELIRATDKAEDMLLGIQDFEEEELRLLHQRFCEMAKTAREELDRRSDDGSDSAS